jgi:KamA family protein
LNNTPIKQTSTNGSTKKYQRIKSYTLRNYLNIPQIKYLDDEPKFAINVVGHVLPFKANNYVINELINWDNIPDDPIFRLTFPQKEMLSDAHFDTMATLLKNGAKSSEIKDKANEIRLQLNPHPAGQLDLNKPALNCGNKLEGMQHKYRETVLFFPSQGQTCHAYCTFCFRWPQFVGLDAMKFAMKEADLLVRYLKDNPQVTDVLFTGGDPMIMKSKILAGYIEPLLEADLPNLKNIRIGTKSLSYWPYKFLTDSDADDTLRLFEKVVQSGKHLAFMAHFSHKAELETNSVQKAIKRILNTGAVIRSQSPILRGINDTPEAWAEMWNEQVRLGIVPYYMFVVRDTGARHYFDIPLVKAWEIYSEAYNEISGVGRTVRGPSMSCNPGKVHLIGVTEIHGEKVFVLKMIQGRNPDWVNKPFFSKYDPSAVWIDDLKPAFGEQKFFFEDELLKMELGQMEKEVSLN